jgi:rhodanese-related sulfurtransferase
MSVKQITPLQASEILQKENGTVYIDVRTENEFANGHVPGSVNIPVVFPNPATRQMAPNPDFTRVIEAHFPRDKKIIVGCQVGGRSQFAGELLVQAGFQDVSNMQGGFGGARDPMGRVVVQGWAQLNLPVETNVDASNSYEGMKRGMK